MSYTLKEFIVCVPAGSNITIIDYCTDTVLDNSTAREILKKLKNKTGNDYSKKSQICGIEVKDNGLVINIDADNLFL